MSDVLQFSENNSRVNTWSVAWNVRLWLLKWLQVLQTHAVALYVLLIHSGAPVSSTSIKSADSVITESRRETGLCWQTQLQHWAACVILYNWYFTFTSYYKRMTIMPRFSWKSDVTLRDPLSRGGWIRWILTVIVNNHFEWKHSEFKKKTNNKKGEPFLLKDHQGRATHDSLLLQCT